MKKSLLMTAMLLLVGASLSVAQIAVPPGGTLQNNTSSASSNGSVLLLNGLAPVTTMQAAGTFSGATFTLQGSVDGSNWANLTCYTLDGGTTINTNGAVSAAGVWRCNTAGINQVRAAVNSGTPGGVTITAQGANVPMPALDTVVAGTLQTDITEFYSAVTFCKADSTNLAVTRVGANDWALARTAAGAETYNIICTLPVPSRTTAGKGWKLTAFSIAQQITTAALTSNTFNALSTTTYANNVADAVAAYGGSITITMPTATQANPYLTAGTVGTPAFMTTANAQINLDFTAVMQNLGVYRLYGVSATWTLQN